MTPHSLHSVKQGAQKEIKNKSSRQALCLTYKLIASFSRVDFVPR